MLKIDSGSLFAAMSDARESVEEHFPFLAEDTGYLNLSTGEIIFVYENEGKAEATHGVNYRKAIAVRRRWEATSDDWLEIPKIPDFNHIDAGMAERMAEDFLSRSGIVAELT